MSILANKLGIEAQTITSANYFLPNEKIRRRAPGISETSHRIALLMVESQSAVYLQKGNPN